MGEPSGKRASTIELWLRPALNALTAEELDAATAEADWQPGHVKVLRSHGLKSLDPVNRARIGRALRPLLRKFVGEDLHWLVSVLCGPVHRLAVEFRPGLPRPLDEAASRALMDFFIPKLGPGRVRLYVAAVALDSFPVNVTARRLLITDPRLMLPEWDGVPVPEAVETGSTVPWPSPPDPDRLRDLRSQSEAAAKAVLTALEQGRSASAAVQKLVEWDELLATMRAALPASLPVSDNPSIEELEEAWQAFNRIHEQQAELAQALQTLRSAELHGESHREEYLELQALIVKLEQADVQDDVRTGVLSLARALEAQRDGAMEDAQRLLKNALHWNPRLALVVSLQGLTLESRTCESSAIPVRTATVRLDADEEQAGDESESPAAVQPDEALDLRIDSTSVAPASAAQQQHREGSAERAQPLAAHRTTAAEESSDASVVLRPAPASVRRNAADEGLPEAPQSTPTGPGESESASDVDARPVQVQRFHEADPATGSGDGKTETLVMRALEADRFGLAYWAARVANVPKAHADVFATAAYAHALRTPTGTCAAAYRTFAGQFAAEDLDGATGLQLLAAAGAVRVTLIYPWLQSLHVLNQLLPRFEDQAVRRLLQIVLETGHMGAHVGGEVAAELRDRAQLEKEVAALVGQAEHLLETFPSKSSPYKRATDVWRDWLRSDGLLGSMLVAVIAEKFDDEFVRVLHDKVLDLRDPRALGEQIDSTDLRLVGRSKERIQFKARDWLRSHAADVLDVVEECLRAVMALSDAQDHEAQPKLMALRKRVADVRPAVQAYLRRLGSEADADGAAAKTAGRSLEASFDLLAGKPLPPANLSAEFAKSGDLLRARGLSLDGLEPRGEITRDMLRTAFEASWIEAFEWRQQEGNHDATQRIVECVGREDPRLAEELDSRRDDKLVEARRRANEVYNRCETTFAAARRRGQIVDEMAVNEFLARLESLRPSPEELEFHLVHQRLDAFLADLAAMQEESVATVREELKARVAQQPQAPEFVQRIDALLDRGDVDTAREFLYLAEKSEPLPDPAATAPLLQSLASILGEDKPPVLRDAARAARRRVKLGPLDFTGLTEETADEVADGLGAWADLSLGPAAEATADALELVLRMLGLEPGRISEGNVSAGRQWVTLTGMTTVGASPVHQFGSGADGNYRVLRCWNRPNVEILLSWLANDSARRASIVLYHGVLDRGQRLQLARALRAQGAHRDVILVDDAVLLAMAVDGVWGSWTQMLQRTLPYTGLTPYKPYVAGDVPPELFYGRDEELDDLLDPMGTLFIYGGRQLGKSALLRAAHREFEKPGPHHRSAYVSVKGIGLLGRTPDEMVGVVARALIDLGVDIPPPRPDGHRELVRSVAAWSAEHPSRRVLLLLDEVDNFLTEDTLVGFRNVDMLKQIWEDTQRRVKPVLAGLHKVQRYSRIPNQPFAHLGKPREIGPLRAQAACDLLTKPMQALGYQFEDEDLASRVLNFTNSHPALIQLYGDHLVAHLRRKPVPVQAPPYVVTADDIEQVYADEQLLQAIRERFRLTLDLDARYLVMANAMGLMAMEAGADQAVPAEILRSACEQWWPAGFASLTPAEFEVLVDEVVGLGVFARADQRGRTYRLRTPNVLRMLGTQRDLLRVLESADALESEQSFEPSAFYRLFEAGAYSFHSPLSEQQLRTLLEPTDQLRVVLGTEALGIAHVADAIQRTKGEVRPRAKGEVHLRNAHVAKWRNACRDHSAGHRIALIDARGANHGQLERLLNGAEDVLNAGFSSGATLSVIVIAQPEPADFWTEFISRDWPSAARVMHLSRWVPASVKLWHHMSDVPVPLGDFSKAVLAGTGGWPILVRELRDLFQGVGRWQLAFEELDRLLREPAFVNDFLPRAAPLPGTGAHRVFELMIDLDDGSLGPADWRALLSTEERLQDVDVASQLAYLRALGVIDVVDGKMLTEAVVTKAWRLAHESAHR